MLHDKNLVSKHIEQLNDLNNKIPSSVFQWKLHLYSARRSMLHSHWFSSVAEPGLCTMWNCIPRHIQSDFLVSAKKAQCCPENIRLEKCNILNLYFWQSCMLNRFTILCVMQSFLQKYYFGAIEYIYIYIYIDTCSKTMCQRENLKCISHTSL